MATEYELTLTDYLSIIRRRAAYLVGIFVVVLLIAIKVAYSVPPSYRSTGTILVESLLASEGMGSGMIRNDLDQRIDIIKQRAMTRENLLQIIKKYDLFEDRIKSMTTTDLIELMRKRIAVESINSYSSQGQTTIAFTISFEDQHPKLALEVANELVTRFLELNLHESMRARADKDLYEVDGSIRSTKEELRLLQAELASASAIAGSSQSSKGVSGEETLATLKEQYARLSATYTESYPDVKALKRKIEALEQESKTSAPAPAPAPTANFSEAAYLIRAKINSANVKLDSLERQKKTLQAKIIQTERTMAQADSDSQQRRHRKSFKNGAGETGEQNLDAGIAPRFEGENKAERFSLLEPPILPEKPYKPTRLKIIVLGFFMALASSGGTVMILESIDKRIRGAEALAHVLGYRPLVVIPYLPILEDEVRRKRMLKRALIAAAIALVALLMAIHFLYMPLNVMFVRAIASLA
jgi:protein tyrosine kinase modulator